MVAGQAAACRTKRACCAALLWFSFGAASASASASAAELRVSVDDGERPVSGAVVSLHSNAAAAAVRPRPARMDQRGSQFVPRLMVAQVGSEVTFPNSDNIRHHVYSFSPAKRFELPLYSETRAAPVRFDTAGVVTLGCNIHDWMVGHIVVLDTPYWLTTDDGGRGRVQAPPGQYTLQVWHPGLPPGAGPVKRPVSLDGSSGEMRISLALVPVAATPAPAIDPRLQKLQDKLRSLKRDR